MTDVLVKTTVHAIEALYITNGHRFIDFNKMEYSKCLPKQFTTPQ